MTSEMRRVGAFIAFLSLYAADIFAASVAESHGIDFGGILLYSVFSLVAASALLVWFLVWEGRRAAPARRGPAYIDVVSLVMVSPGLVYGVLSLLPGSHGISKTQSICCLLSCVVFARALTSLSFRITSQRSVS